MSYVYEGLATVVVIDRYEGSPPAELTMLECPVRLSKIGPNCTRVELASFLEGPENANMLRVILPDGLVVQGLIVGACNQQLGGWLLLDVESGELGFAPPANGAESSEGQHG